MRSDFGSGSLFPNSMKDESRAVSIQLESDSFKSSHRAAQVLLTLLYWCSELPSSSSASASKASEACTRFFDVCATTNFCTANWAQRVLALIFNMFCNLLDKPHFLQQLDKHGCSHHILQVFHNLDFFTYPIHTNSVFLEWVKTALSWYCTTFRKGHQISSEYIELFSFFQA